MAWEREGILGSHQLKRYGKRQALWRTGEYSRSGQCCCTSLAWCQWGSFGWLCPPAAVMQLSEGLPAVPDVMFRLGVPAWLQACTVYDCACMRIRYTGQLCFPHCVAVSQIYSGAMMWKSTMAYDVTMLVYLEQLAGR